MKRWLPLLLLLGCSRGGVDGGDRDLASPPVDPEDLAGADLLGADLAPGPDLRAADLAPGAPSELDCYYGWKALGTCPAPEISESFLASGCAGTTGVFVVGRYFQHGNQYESTNGWMPHGPYAVTPKLSRDTWNWMTPRAVCITTNADATYWTNFEMQLRNPDGQLSNKVIVKNRIGGPVVLPSSGSSEPFDPSACLDPAMTQAQAVARFPMGASSTALGTVTIKRRSRPCNTLTGCAAWGAADSEGTAAAGLVTSGSNVNFTLAGRDCGKLNSGDFALSYNSCSTTGAAQSYNVHVAAACLMLWQTTRTTPAGDGSYTQTDYGAVLRY